MSKVYYPSFDDGSDLVPPYINKKYDEILKPMEDAFYRLVDLSDKEEELKPITLDLYKAINTFKKYAQENSPPLLEENHGNKQLSDS